MVMITNKIRCCGCGACSKSCPVDAIQMKPDEEGFIYPSINLDVCINCGKCDRVCPVQKEQDANIQKDIKVFAAINRDDRVKKESSSGGIFSLLAQQVISENGVVFGASINDSLTVEHTYTCSLDDLIKYRGSKYVQSSTIEVYPKVKQYLENDHPVLFTGTPCQISGLKCYLGKEYPNLICAEIVCHGVPSPDILKRYLKYYEHKFQKKIKTFYMRDKTYGWKNFCTKLEFSDGSSEIIPRNEDFYIQTFLNNYDLRPICYTCPFKNGASDADISLADCWGIKHILPEIDDDCGVSLLLIHSSKGMKLLNKLEKDRIKKWPVEYELAVQYNPAIKYSVYRPKERDHYFMYSARVSTKALTDIHFNTELKWKIIRKILKMIF